MLLGGLHGPAVAGECEGVSFPDQVQVSGAILQLNGLGLRFATMLEVKVYVAALYVETKSPVGEDIVKSAAPKQMVLHFVRDVTRSELTKAWDEGFARNAGTGLAALAERISTLTGWMSDMTSGQRMNFTHEPGVGTRVDIGGAEKGSIEGDDFAAALFSIWLGQHPPNEELKAGLLGAKCG